jgi:hypothetical protein
LIASQADIVSAISSSGNAEHVFVVQADIVSAISSDVNAEREFAVQADIVWNIPDDVLHAHERSFVVGASIQTDINTIHPQVEKQFLSTSSITYVVISDGQARRIFASQADIDWNISASHHQLMYFVSGADIVSSIVSDSRARREFAFDPNIQTVISDSILRRYSRITSNPAIGFNIDSDAFKSNQFGILPGITFDLSTNIRAERNFSVQSEIDFNISDLFHIYVMRNLVSTVNIIVNVKSLNILNMSIDDLFPNKMRSITPKQTVEIV